MRDSFISLCRISVVIFFMSMMVSEYIFYRLLMILMLNVMVDIEIGMNGGLEWILDLVDFLRWV